MSTIGRQEQFTLLGRKSRLLEIAWDWYCAEAFHSQSRKIHGIHRGDMEFPLPGDSESPSSNAHFFVGVITDSLPYTLRRLDRRGYVILSETLYSIDMGNQRMWLKTQLSVVFILFILGPI